MQHHCKPITLSTFPCISALCFFLVLSHTLAAEPNPDDPSLAKKVQALFKEGVDQYDEGNYLKALELFREASKLKTHPSILYNIAWCYSKLGENAKAAKAFLVYQTTDGKKSDDMIEKAEAELARLEKLVAKVAITCEEEGVTVKIDGETVGKTPLKEPIFLEPGEYAVSAHKKGFEPYKGARLFEAGEEAAINVALVAITEKEPATEPARLVIKSQLEKGDIFVDGKSVAKLKKETILKMPPGKHDIKAVAEGYEDIVRSIELKEGEIRQVVFKFKAAKGFLTVKTNASAAVITIDDGADSLSASEPIPLESGDHTVRVESDGMLGWEGDVQVGPGDGRVLTVTLMKDKKKLRYAFWTTLSLGLVSILGVIVTGSYAVSWRNSYESEKSEYESYEPPYPSSYSVLYENLKDKYNTGKRFQLAADIFLGFSCTFIASAVVIAIFKPFKKESSARLSLSSHGAGMYW